MSYVLAVDVGTSFTAAAVVRFNQGASPVPECLPLGLRGTSVPSVVYYPEEGPVLVGEAAERRWLDAPTRVVREFKRRIGDDVPFSLGRLTVSPEDVFATMARWVADRAAEREGEPASAIYLTHPAAWGNHRLSVIRDALAAHGLAEVTLLSEPVAAALHYASQVRVEDGSTIAVYDLGGGTFDTAVLRKTGSSRFELAGRPDGIEDLGGADFDAAVFRYVASHTGDAIAGLDLQDPAVLSALSRLQRECVEAKEALSADSEASIQVLLPGIQQQVRLVRADFEALIEEPLRETVDAVEQSLSQLQLEPADLSAVLLIGGSSRIPLVAQLVSEQLDRPIAVDADPKSSICLGAAVAALLEHEAAAALASGTEPGAAGEGARSGVGLSGAAPGPEIPLRPGLSRRTSAPAGIPVSLAGLSAGAHRQRGAHAPTPTVRLTAVAAAAALLTVLTATAAQSPDGFGNLTAVFVPQAGASTTGGSDVSDGGPTADPTVPSAEADGAAGPVAAVSNLAPLPLAGIEASASRNRVDVPAGVEASVPEKGAVAAGAVAAGAVTDGTGASGSPGGSAGTGTGVVLDSAQGGSGGTDAATPTDTGTTGPGTPTAGASQPGPTDSGTPEATPGGTTTGTDTATPEPATTTDPATASPAPTDPAATDPAPTDPATSPEPAPEPTSGPTATPTPEQSSVPASTATASDTALTTIPAA